MVKSFPLRRKSLKLPNVCELVAQEIKDYIILHNLQQGDRLPAETEIAATLEVSRTSVREALRSLEALGIIETRRGEGRVVRSFNFDSILENMSYSLLFDQDDFEAILDIRQALECYFIVDAMKKITDEDLRTLKKVLPHVDDRERGNILINPDAQFHQIIFAPLKNEPLLKLIRVFWRLLFNIRGKFGSTKPELARALRSHEEIVAALEAKDEEKVQACMKHHFDLLRNDIRSTRLREKQSSP